MGTRSDGHLPGRLFWNIDGRDGDWVSIQYHQVAHVLRIYIEFLRDSHSFRQTGWNLVDPGSIGGLFNCPEVRGPVHSRNLRKESGEAEERREQNRVACADDLISAIL